MKNVIRAAEMVTHPPGPYGQCGAALSRWSSDTSCAVSPMGRRGSPHLALRNGRRSCGYQSSGRRRLVAARPDIEPDVAVTQTPKQKPRPRLTAWAKQSGHPLWVQKTRTERLEDVGRWCVHRGMSSVPSWGTGRMSLRSRFGR